MTAPVVSLATPTISLAQLNAQGYIDIIYTNLPKPDGGGGTLPADPIDKDPIELAGVAPFTITGLLGDLDVSASRPTIVGGAPLLIAGAAAGSTSVTYRYFLKDKNPNNTLGLFTGTGAITLVFDRDAIVESGRDTRRAPRA